ILSFRVDGAPPGPVPTAHIRFEVLKPVAVRTEISPRNVATGASLCSGRLSSVYPQPRSPLSVSVPVSALAGLESCRFPAGDYSVSVTITPTDLELDVQLKPITFESKFTVAPPF